MKKEHVKEVVEYWLEYYTYKDLCSLCGNSGVIHTEGVRSAAGVECGRKNYCICPNGQTMRIQVGSTTLLDTDVFCTCDKSKWHYYEDEKKYCLYCDKPRRIS